MPKPSFLERKMRLMEKIANLQCSYMETCTESEREFDFETQDHAIDRIIRMDELYDKVRLIPDPEYVASH